MTEFEICQSYRLAKSKYMQRRILADLNLCSTFDIDDILERNALVIERSPSEIQQRIIPETAIKMLIAGASAEELADRLNTSLGYVNKWITQEMRVMP